MTHAAAPQRYAMVGAGRQAPYLLSAVAPLAGDGFSVVAIADLHLGAANRRAGEFEIPGIYAGADAFARMLECEELDGVMIVTPHETHASLAIPAMEHGLDVFVEKPMAESLTRARTIVDAAERLRRTLGTGYLYSAWAPWLTSQAAQVGPIAGIRARWTRADDVQGAEFARDPDGGVLRDLFGHLFTAADRVMPGDPVSVRASGSREATIRRHGSQFQGWDTVGAAVRYSDGSVAKIETSWADGGPADEEITLSVYGASGQVDYLFPGPREDALTLKPVLRRAGEEARFGPAPDLYGTVAGRHLGNWHRARQGLEPLGFTGRDGLRVECVISATAEALRTGESVEVPEWHATSVA